MVISQIIQNGLLGGGLISTAGVSKIGTAGDGVKAVHISIIQATVPQNRRKLGRIHQRTAFLGIVFQPGIELGSIVRQLIDPVDPPLMVARGQ